MNFKRGILAGAVAMVAMMAFSYLAPRMGLYGMNVPRTLGGVFVLDPQAAYWLGLAIHLFGGVVLLPILYGSLIVRWLPGPAAVRGGLWGVALWVLWAVPGMSILAAHPQITGGMMQDPGLLMQNLGPTAPAESLLSLFLYGVFLGWIFGKDPSGQQPG